MAGIGTGAMATENCEILEKKIQICGPHFLTLKFFNTNIFNTLFNTKIF